MYYCIALHFQTKAHNERIARALKRKKMKQMTSALQIIAEKRKMASNGKKKIEHFRT